MASLGMAALPAAANLGFAKRVAPASAVSAKPSRASRRSPFSVSAHSQGPAEEEAGGEESSARAFRRALGQSANYSRKHKKDADAAKLMEEQGVGVVSKGERRTVLRSDRSGSSVCFFVPVNTCFTGPVPTLALHQAASSSR